MYVIFFGSKKLQKITLACEFCGTKFGHKDAKFYSTCTKIHDPYYGANMVVDVVAKKQKFLHLCRVVDKDERAFCIFATTPIVT